MPSSSRQRRARAECCLGPVPTDRCLPDNPSVWQCPGCNLRWFVGGTVTWLPRPRTTVRFVRAYYDTFAAGDVAVVQDICYGRCSHRPQPGVFLHFDIVNHVDASFAVPVEEADVDRETREFASMLAAKYGTGRTYR